VQRARYGNTVEAMVGSDGAHGDITTATGSVTRSATRWAIRWEGLHGVFALMVALRERERTRARAVD